MAHDWAKGGDVHGNTWYTCRNCGEQQTWTVTGVNKKGEILYNRRPLVGCCKPPVEIYHVVKDESDPSWKGWDIIRANGRADPGQAFSLRHVRELFGVKLHRGKHSKTQLDELPPDEIIQPGWYRVYWFEVKKEWLL